MATNNGYFNYGHISDVIPSQKDVNSTLSKTVYWNKNWVLYGYRVVLRDLIINEAANPSITFSVIGMSVTLTSTTCTFKTGTTTFKTNSTISFPIGNVFDQEEISFFIGFKEVKLINDQLKLCYFIKINDTYYQAAGTTAISHEGRANQYPFTLEQLPLHKFYLSPPANTGISYAVSFSGCSVRVDTIAVLGSSLFGAEDNYPSDFADEDIDIQDIYEHEFLLSHLHINCGSAHNHTLNSTMTYGRLLGGGSSLGYAGLETDATSNTESTFSYSKNDGIHKPFFLVPTMKTGSNYKARIGASDFIISAYGYFNQDTTAKYHKIPIKVFLGKFTANKIGNSQGKLSDGTAANSRLVISLLIDKDNKRIQGNIYDDTSTVKNISELNLKWHPLFEDRWQLSIEYDHAHRKLNLYSGLISKSQIAKDHLTKERYLLHTENNVLFSEKTDAFVGFGPDEDNQVDADGDIKYRNSLTDFAIIGYIPSLIPGKIYYSNSFSEQDTIPDNTMRVLTGKTYDLYIFGNDIISTGADGLQTNIEEIKTPLGISLVDERVTENYRIWHYTLNPKTEGSYVISSWYKNLTTTAITRFECYRDLSVKIVVSPTFSVTGQGGTNSSLQDIGSASRPRFSVKSEDDFNLVVDTNLDIMPVLVNTTTLDIRTGTRISAKKFSFLVKPFEVGTFNVTVKYDASDYNEAKSIAVSIQVLANKKDTTISLQTVSGSALQNITTTSGETEDFVVISNRNRPPDIEISQRRTLSIELVSTATVSSTENYKHTYRLNGQFPGQNIMVLFTYEDDGVFAGNSTNFLVNVESVPLDPWVDPDTASVVLLQKDSTGEWHHALSMNSTGTIISKTDIKVSASLKTALKTFTNNLKT